MGSGATALDTALERAGATGEEAAAIAEDGIESAFDLEHEVSEKLRSGQWVGDCLVYVNSQNKLNYCVGGEVITLGHLDRRMYMLGYLPRDSRVFLMDKGAHVTSFTIPLSILEYQTAVVRRDFDAANSILPAVDSINEGIAKVDRTTVPELDVKMRLGTHCYHHAWHADLWYKRLPELREMKPERLTVPANAAMERFIEAMTEPEAPELTIEKLVGVYRVLIPRFIAAYTYHRNNTSEITDAPTIRSINFILQDEFDDWRDGEMLLHSLSPTPDHVRRAAEHQAALEAIMVDAGGITGPGSIGTAETTSTEGGA